jgi:hypothetical protein
MSSGPGHDHVADHALRFFFTIRDDFDLDDDSVHVRSFADWPSALAPAPCEWIDKRSDDGFSRPIRFPTDDPAELAEIRPATSCSSSGAS